LEEEKALREAAAGGYLDIGNI